MKYFKKSKFWYGLMLLATVFAVVIYLTYQQASRIGADEPQRSIAKSAAIDIQNSKNPDEIASGYIDIANNMAPFVIIYDNYGKVVAGNGYLNNSVPQVPIGVLSVAKDKGENAVTWRPENNNVRIASVSVQAGEYYVLSGRNLQVVENQINTFFKWLLAAWVVVLISLFALSRAILPKNTDKK